MPSFYIISSFLLWLSASSCLAQNFSGIPRTPACSAVPRSRTCEQCVLGCWPSGLACAFPCHRSGWKSDACQGCLQKYPKYTECRICIADCFQWDTDRPSVCVDCNDPNVQRQMCLGSFNQLGFCTTSNSASFTDNGGSPRTNCNAPTTECDVVAGGISRCAISSSSLLVAMFENSFNSSATSLPNTTLSAANGPDKPTIDTVKGWKYRGCYIDSMKDRVLKTRRMRLGAMTVQRCAEVCKGYRYFGVEYSDECYCGDTLVSGAKQVPDVMCDRVCMADYRHYCGGSLKLGLYEADPDVAIA